MLFGGSAVNQSVSAHSKNNKRAILENKNAHARSTNPEPCETRPGTEFAKACAGDFATVVRSGFDFAMSSSHFFCRVQKNHRNKPDVMVKTFETFVIFPLFVKQWRTDTTSVDVNFFLPDCVTLLSATAA